MATDFDNLIADLERSYEELQARMSDPSVYNDHREAADVGRRLKELEQPYKLAQEWKSASDDLAAARGDADLKELGSGVDYFPWAGSEQGPLRAPLAKPVIAAIEGHACAGGLGVALFCDIRLLKVSRSCDGAGVGWPGATCGGDPLQS